MTENGGLINAENRLTPSDSHYNHSKAYGKNEKVLKKDGGET